MTKCMTIVLAMTALLWVQGGVICPQVAAQSLSSQVSEVLWERVQIGGAPLTLTVAREPIYAKVLLPRFYMQRLFWPAWSDDTGVFLAPSESLLRALRDAEIEGLRPHDYHLARLEKMLAEVRQQQASGVLPPPRSLAMLDLLLTDAFLTYGMHLTAGRNDPVRSGMGLGAKQQSTDLPALLQQALATEGVAEALADLLPSQPGYSKLRQALARYRRLAASGGWPKIPPGPALRKGERHVRVVTLRNRLRSTGELSRPPDDETLFDETVERAVRLFQTRHSLEANGMVGAATLTALNVPAEVRARQIAQNMERWRWLPHDLGGRHILVNIPEFTLHIMDRDQSMMTMRVVVGKADWPTPVVSSQVTSVVLRPAWDVPQSIIKEEILPILRRNPLYLAQRDMKMWQVSGTSKNHFPYRIRQEPGPRNPLGDVKFQFPNPFAVYLHDTTSRSLFAKPVRAFSHGCVRLERPIDLAEYLLRGQWTRARILATAAKRTPQAVPLPEPLPIHLVYRTIWVDEDDAVHFLPDIYDYDPPEGNGSLNAQRHPAERGVF